MKQKYNNKIDNEIEILWNKVLFYGLCGLIIFFSSWYTIDVGYRGVLTTFGKPDMNVKTEGFHLKIPFIQDITKMEVRTQKYQAELTASSKDLQDVATTIAINYHLIPEKVPNIYRDLGLGYSDTVIMPLEQEANKGIIATFTAEELITKREQVRQAMKEVLTKRLLERNIIVEDVSIINFKFSESFSQAIEAKVTAEQNALREQNNLKVVEFQAQQRVEQAKGESQAIQIINEQLQKSPQYINYLTIQKWNGIMPLSLGSGTLLSISGQTTK